MFEHLVMTFARSLQGVCLTMSCAVHPERWEFSPLFSSKAPFPIFKDFQSTQMAKFSSLDMTGLVADTSLTCTSFSPFTELHSCLWLLLWCNCCCPGYVCKSPRLYTPVPAMYMPYSGLWSVYIYIIYIYIYMHTHVLHMYCEYIHILYMLLLHYFVYQVIEITIEMVFSCASDRSSSEDVKNPQVSAATVIKILNKNAKYTVRLITSTSYHSIVFMVLCTGSLLYSWHDKKLLLIDEISA